MHLMNTAYHPHTKDQVEQFNKTVIPRFRQYVTEIFPTATIYATADLRIEHTGTQID